MWDNALDIDLLVKITKRLDTATATGHGHLRQVGQRHAGPVQTGLGQAGQGQAGQGQRAREDRARADQGQAGRARAEREGTQGKAGKAQRLFLKGPGRRIV